MGPAEHLSALDAAFLQLESPQTPMHVGVVLTFEAAPLRRSDGSLDVQLLTRAVAAQLHRVPHFRQRVALLPLGGTPLWIDDSGFDLDYHLRHVALPKPGDAGQLERLTGWLLSQPLDPAKPLWEIWVVEGVEGDRIALVAKIHHCMVDGLAGIGVLGMMLRGDQERRIREPPPWTPRPPPGAARRWTEALRARLAAPRSLLEGTLQAVREPQRSLESALDGLVGAAEALREGLRSAVPTSLNPPRIGPHRRLGTLRLELAAVKAVGARVGATVNDVVLATAAGGLGRFLRGRGETLHPPRMRVMVPVSTRRPGEGPEVSNRVALIVASVPVGKMDPVRRLRSVMREMQRLKRGRLIHGTELLEEAGEWMTPSLVAQIMHLAARARSFNVVVTNVPGPPRPLYLLGARLLEVYPVVPLYENQALGVALISYAGTLHWGLHADRDLVRDLDDLGQAILREFEDLAKAPVRTAR